MFPRPSGGCETACEELATAGVPEPSPPSHCDMFASGSLLECLLQSPAKKSVWLENRPVFLQGGIFLWLPRIAHLWIDFIASLREGEKGH